MVGASNVANGTKELKPAQSFRLLGRFGAASGVKGTKEFATQIRIADRGVTLLPAELTETVEVGWNCLTGDDPDLIVSSVIDAGPAPAHPQLYGDGNASGRIAETLVATMTR